MTDTYAQHRQDHRAAVLDTFLKDTAQHDLVIKLDQGMYRHLRFQKPGTALYCFDVITWPGHLAITGDMGAAVFSRLPDMFEFFRPNRYERRGGDLFINPGYWAQKCNTNEGSKTEFSKALFDLLVLELYTEHVDANRDDEGNPPAWAADLRKEIETELLSLTEHSTTAAFNAMDLFEHEDSGFKISDPQEYLTSTTVEYTVHFLWRLYAIAYAVREYDRVKNPTTGEA